MGDEVGQEVQYEVFADEFRAHAEDGFYNAYYDRPACLDLLGDVAGRRVLDAACGPGLYAKELTARGAGLVGFDQSPRMVALAQQNVPNAQFRVHDLSEPVAWLTDPSIDLVLVALAIEYLDDRVSALRELRRVLKPSGALVLSRLHPTGDWLRHGGNYFQPRVIEETWSRGWQVRYGSPHCSRPARSYTKRGFLIERLLEPTPIPEAATLDPDAYRRHTEQPTGFLAIRAVPRP